MEQYDKFAPFYDSIMGDRVKAATYLHKLIRENSIRPASLLELGCGTGSILSYFSRDFKVFGIELSPEMLKVAKRKVPTADLQLGDISRFQLNQKFDVILCVFDTINHLLTFPKWSSLFKSAANHLCEGGVFLFDVNTQRKLERHVSDPAWASQVGKDLFVIDVKKAKKNIFDWEIQVFHHKNKELFERSREIIKETAFPALKVRKELKKFFSHVSILDPDRARHSLLSEQLYYICKNPKV